MKYLARFNLAWLAFDLAIAKAAPDRNHDHIAWLNDKISEWELLLWQKEWSLK